MLCGFRGAHTRSGKETEAGLRTIDERLGMGEMAGEKEVHGAMMRLALQEAVMGADGGEVPVGAVLVDGRGRLIAKAHNMPISLCDPTAHAEILVLREGARRAGNYRLPGTVLYVTIEPCAMCLGAMLHARVATLVFGACDPKSGAAGSVVDLTKVAAFNHTIKVVGGVEEETCARVIQDFFRRRRLRLDGKQGEVPKWP